MEKLKTLKIKEATHKNLLELGKKGESFSDIIDKLIKNHKKKVQKH
jgi:predicted CopG family antitoxin